MNKHFSAAKLTQMALLTALLCISAYIVIPLGFTPITLTLQTLIINLIALLLTPSEAFFTVLIYILLGLIGLPVFSGGMGGAGKLFGPTGGYIFAFLLSAPAMSFVKTRMLSIFKKILKSNNSKTIRIISYSVTAIVVGMVIVYFIGTAYMKFTMDKTWLETLTIAVIPFMPLDILKCIAASLIAVLLEKVLKNTNNTSVVSPQ